MKETNGTVFSTSESRVNADSNIFHGKNSMRETSILEVDIFYVFDVAALALILLQVFILDYLDLSFFPRIAIFAMAFVRAFFSKRRYALYYAVAVSAALVLVMSSLIVGGLNYGALIRNLYYLLCSFGAVLYIAVLAVDRPGVLRQLSKRAFIPANILLVVNYIVVYIQLNYHTLVAVNNTGYTEATNYVIFWYDAAAGLFGFCGTHELCLFTIFVIIYDFWYLGNVSTASGKTGLLLWLVTVVIAALYTATLNDNKALFLLLPIYLLALALPKMSVERIGNHIGTMICGAVFVLIASVTFFSLNDVRYFLDQRITSLVGTMSQNVFVGSDASGSYERVAMVGYAITSPETWAFGSGIGAHSLHGEGYLGFRHFGQSDLGAVPIICGIWFELLIVISYVVMFVQITRFDAKHCSISQVISITIVLLVTMGFTRVLTSVPIGVCLTMVIWAFGLVWNFDRQQSNKAN